MSDQIELGDEVRDVITDFSGVVTGKCAYITGCNQVLVNPGKLVDGKFPDSHWIDEQRVVLISKQKVQIDNGSTPGADKPAPVR